MLLPDIRSDSFFSKMGQRHIVHVTLSHTLRDRSRCPDARATPSKRKTSFLSHQLRSRRVRFSTFGAFRNMWRLVDRVGTPTTCLGYFWHTRMIFGHFRYVWGRCYIWYTGDVWYTSWYTTPMSTPSCFLVHLRHTKMMFAHSRYIWGRYYVWYTSDVWYSNTNNILFIH